MRLAEVLLSAPDLDAVRMAIESASPEDRREAIEPLAAEVLRLLRVDTRLALGAAERARLVADSDDDPVGRARARWVQGHAFAASIRNREAIECYRSAAGTYREIGRPADVARVAIGHVNALTNVGRYREALTLGERARRDLLRTGQRTAAARMDLNLGNIYHHLEKPRLALGRYDRALRECRRNGDAAMRRIVQMNRGTALSVLGRLDEAEKLYVRVRREAARSGERLVRAFADFNLGYIRFQKGDFGRAYDSLDEARRTFESSNDDHSLALTMIDLAEMLIEVNRHAPAKELARRARDLAGKIGRSHERARAALFEGIAALGIGAGPEAEKLLRLARAEFREKGGGASEALCGVYLAEAATLADDRARATALLRRAVATFRAEGLKLHEGAARLRLAALVLEAGNVDAAQSETDRAAAILRRVPSPWLRARTSHLRGRIAEARGDLDRAVRHYRQAVARIDSIRGRIGIDEFRVSFAEDKTPVFSDLVAAILRRGGRRAVADAFAVVETSRSRALVDLLAGRLAAVVDDPAARRLLERMEKLRAELNALYGFERPGSGQRRIVRRGSGDATQIRSREEELTELVRRLQRRNTRLGALTHGETVTLDQAREELPTDATLVEYFLSPRGAWAFVLDRNDGRALPLPISFGEATRRMARLRFHLERGCWGREHTEARAQSWHEAVDHHLRFLAERLWEPLGVREGRVVVVPHGPLHSLPFGALPLSDGARLVDRHVLSHLPSASARRYLAGATPSRNARRAAGDLRVLAVEVTDDRIPEARREIEEVRGIFRRGRVLRGPRATAERFRREVSRADVVHVATHGSFRTDDPAFSALRFVDGWMSLPEIYGLRLDAKLVCLSACQSGRNWVGGGDELVGLTRGFLHAGASSLLVSLWPVDDAATAELMIRFYRGLRRGGVVDETLRDAMQSLRGEYSHPYHWAPFILVGGAGSRLQGG